ncbi:MAG: hypothetical protein AABO57_15100 [Acidobacteriota bacterium]
MSETILVGRGPQITSIPRAEWEGHLSKVPEAMKTRLCFMSREHQLVRYFVVRELPRIGKPIAPKIIAARLMLALPRVNEILAELEERLFFLVRDSHGHVSWAYPVTADKTPHRLVFNTGERLYAA